MLNSKIIILDGAMGRELEYRGAPFKQSEWSALAMMETPELVKEVHIDFIRSGTSVISTNSYALVPFRISEESFQKRGRALSASSGQIARAAVEEIGSKILVQVPSLAFLALTVPTCFNLTVLPK